MPPLLHARPPADPDEQRTLRRLAASRHAPADWILRARIVVRSRDGERPARSPPGWAVTPRPCGSGCTASTPTVSTGSVTDPGRVGHAGSTRPSVASWSPWSARTRPAAWSGRPTAPWLRSTPSSPVGGRWMRWSRPPTSWGSRSSAVRSVAFCWRRGHAGGTRARGRPVLTQRSSPKGPRHRSLSPPAGRGDGGLR